MGLETRSSPEKLAVLVIGTDTLIEALPARPIQLAHACGALGFDLAIPLSWGDELVAEAALRALESRGPAPAVFCSCPFVRERLLQAGSDLAGAMVSLVSSPVAVARHLRTSLGSRLRTLSFVGRCPSATTPEYDLAYDPEEFFAMLRTRGVDLQEQSDVFMDLVPPDRRRFVSLPGGCPTPEVLWRRCNERTLVEVEGRDLSIELAQQLLSSQPILVDAATAMGCSCSGVTEAATGPSVRVAVTSLEPPRSRTPVVSDSIVPLLTLAVDASSGQIGRGDQAAGVRHRAPMAVTPSAALRLRRHRATE